MPAGGGGKFLELSGGRREVYIFLKIIRRYEI
jgi:hypothetical protein